MEALPECWSGESSEEVVTETGQHHSDNQGQDCDKQYVMNGTSD